MKKELVFKMRLDEADKARLDALANHYSAPAATVVRILIKEKFDDVRSVCGDRTFRGKARHGGA